MAEHWEKERGQGERRRERSDGGEEEEKEEKEGAKENGKGTLSAVYMKLSVVIDGGSLTSIPVSTSMKVFRISCSFCSKITTTLALQKDSNLSTQCKGKA